MASLTTNTSNPLLVPLKRAACAQVDSHTQHAAETLLDLPLQVETVDRRERDDSGTVAFAETFEA
jgi:hypothetical protein